MNENETLYSAHGKLLLTAEYFVLDGATALALPVKYGQSLTVFPNTPVGGIHESPIHWQSFDEKGDCWFEATFHSDNFNILSHNNETIAQRLQTIFKKIKEQLSVVGCRLPVGVDLRTELTFPKNWGLGTSSTLIYLLAKWAGVDPFRLQFDTFGGSGYDIACAGADGPILYKKENGRAFFERCEFHPPFADQLYFVFLGKKQDSREGIKRYRRTAVSSQQSAVGKEITELTHLFLKEKTLVGLEKLIVEHEQLVGSVIGLERAKSLYFNGFWGEVKSLGAWGGDFVLVTSGRSEQETKRYFNEKGFEVFIRYKEMMA